MEIYNKKFADFYNKGWNDFSVKVFNFFKEDLKNKDVCDVACGTGSFIKLTKKITKSICGVDISKDFIKYAKKKNPKVSFKVINVESWKDQNKYDVVVCFYDSVNHFNNWEKAFKNIYESLRKNGKFIFDINTIQGLKNWQGTYLNKIDGGYIYMKGEFLPNNRARMEIKVFNEDGFLVSEGEVLEKAYSSRDIIKILKSVGFNKVKNIRNVIYPNKKGRIFFECIK